MTSDQENIFEDAMERYKSGVPIDELIKDFQVITTSSPNNSAGWTCLAWLQLLCDEYEDALRSARIAVKLNAQDPQARINLSLALLETKSKGVRDHIDVVKRILFAAPDFKIDLKESVEDGLTRKPDWKALQKIKDWLDF